MRKQIKELLAQKVEGVNWNIKYRLYVDEGGMLGKPRFYMTLGEVEDDNFCFIGELEARVIWNYYIGKMTSFYIMGYCYNECCLHLV